MGKLVLGTMVSLDGVMQGPGGKDEDTRGGFEKGGWVWPYFDERLLHEHFVQSFASAGGFLLGRRTYEIFAAHWPRQTDDDPFAAKLNSLPKFVASRTLTQRDVTWAGTTVIEDAVAAVPQIKEQVEGDLLVQGSGDLAQTLMGENLVDEYKLTILPVVLGRGKRLFERGLPFSLELLSSTATNSGVVMQKDRPGGPVSVGSPPPEQ